MTTPHAEPARASLRHWIAGARPRTLPAAVAPVLAGTAVALHVDAFVVGKALLALGLALALQVGVNYANDYSDGVRGTDVERVGPMRLTASGAARPEHVRRAAFLCFGVAALLGAWLVVISGHLWLAAVGVVAIIAAWGYTGGRRPYGYRGLGEVGVFVFFGLVATLGTMYTQADRINDVGVLGAVAMGLLACALLMVNNIRDIPGDAAVGKRTLAVRLGERRARWLYAFFVVVPFLLAVACVPTAPWVLLTLLLTLPAAFLVVPVLLGLRGRGLVLVLSGTGMLQLGFAAAMAMGLAI